MQKNDGLKLVSTRLRPYLWKQVRHACIEQGATVQELIAKYVEDGLSRDIAQHKEDRKEDHK